MKQERGLYYLLLLTADCRLSPSENTGAAAAGALSKQKRRLHFSSFAAVTFFFIIYNSCNCKVKWEKSAAVLLFFFFFNFLKPNSYNNKDFKNPLNGVLAKIFVN